MVFGYYHATIRTVGKGILPEVDRMPGAVVKEKVKLGHILWIPFIPLGKVWVMEHQGKMYNLPDPAIRTLNSVVGRSSYPWYSFLGFILIPLILGFVWIGDYFDGKAREKRSKQRFEQTLATNLKAIDSPDANDIFFFKQGYRNKTAIKVSHSNKDSIYFIAPLNNENKKWGTNNWAAGFYAGSNPTRIVALAKSDIKKSFPNQYGENMRNKGMDGEAISLNGLVQLEKVQNVANLTNVPVVDQKSLDEVKTSMQYFLTHAGKVDSVIAMMDQVSHNFYDKAFKDCSTKSDKEIVTMTNKSSKNPNTYFELMLYTKNVFTSEDRFKVGDDGKVTDADKKDYMFFLQLMERGLLTFNSDVLSNMQVVSATIPSANKARVIVKGKSNMLKSPKDITFPVMMSKENGKWKVNLPSSYSYSESQIRNNSFVVNSRPLKEWKEHVVSGFGDLEKDDKPLPAVWRN